MNLESSRFIYLVLRLNWVLEFRWKPETENASLSETKMRDWKASSANVRLGDNKIRVTKNKFCLWGYLCLSTWWWRNTLNIYICSPFSHIARVFRKLQPVSKIHLEKWKLNTKFRSFTNLSKSLRYYRIKLLSAYIYTYTKETWEQLCPPLKFKL